MDKSSWVIDHFITQLPFGSGITALFDRTGDDSLDFGIFWSTTEGLHIVRGPIFYAYQNMGGDYVFGYPKSEQQDLPGPNPHGVIYNQFQNGYIVWSEAAGAVPATSLRMKDYRVVFENVFSHNSHDDYGAGVWDMRFWVSGGPARGDIDGLLLNREHVDQHELVHFGDPEVTLTIPQDILQGFGDFGIHVVTDGLERDCTSDDAPSPFEEGTDGLIGCFNNDDALGIVDITIPPGSIGPREFNSNYNHEAQERGLDAGNSEGDYTLKICISDYSLGSCELEG
jgi:LGFP repeat